MAEPRSASAPGKAVLTGEYAVLEGAPAVVAAVNRRVQVHWTPAAAPAGQIRLSAAGLAAPAITASPGELAGHSIWAATLRLADSLGLLPQLLGGHLHLDSAALHQGGRKLGLGSSAAVAVAMAHAAGAVPLDLACLVAAHNAAHQSQGSGVDIAASLHGAVLRYHAGSVGNAPRQQTQALPAGLLVRFLWPGQSASTPAMVAGFRAWRRTDSMADATMAHLARAAADAANGLTSDAATAVSAVAQWGAHLAEFAAHAGLPLHSGGHAALVALADGRQLAYKPCGAGAGDIGMAVAADPAQLARFCRQAEAAGATLLDLEIDPHGVQGTH